jgi:VIT1/CCC1 family predicted Fe2+/Mn2+ transporter
VLGADDGLVSNLSLVMGVAGAPPPRSGGRQLAIGLAAAALTYGIGVLLGVSTGA